MGSEVRIRREDEINNISAGMADAPGVGGRGSSGVQAMRKGKA